MIKLKLQAMSYEEKIAAELADVTMTPEEKELIVHAFVTVGKLKTLYFYVKLGKKS